MGKYYVQLGGVYDIETEPGTVGDPDQTPQTVSWLDPTFLSIGCDGTVNELRCISNKHAEDFDAAITRGQWLQIQTGYGSASGSNNCVFDGVVVNTHITIGGDSEGTELVALDHGSYLLRRIVLHGQYRRDNAKEQSFFNSGPTPGSNLQLDWPNDVVLIDTPTVFNPDGQPNMTVDRFIRMSQADETIPPSFPIFEVPFRDQRNSSGQVIQSSYWTIADAIEYLLNVTKANWCIDPQSFTQTRIQAALVNGNPIVSNIVVEGKSLGQALSELLTPHNYGFWVDPALNSNNLHNINFYCKGRGHQRQLWMSSRGTNAGHSAATLIHADLLFDNAGTINRIEAFGDRLSFTTLAHSNPPTATPPLPKLVKCWRDADLVYPPADGSGAGQPNWWDQTFRQNFCNAQLLTQGSESISGGIFGIGRTWIVNLGEDPYQNVENLCLDLVPSNSGSGSGSFDYSGSGSMDCHITGDNSVDMRRFEKPDLFVINSEGGILAQEEVVVEMSTNSGATWEIVDRSEYKIMPDSLGIVFISPSLDLLGVDISAIDGSGSGSNSGSGFGKGYWQALYDGSLQIRILASIKSDERIHCSITNDGSAFPLAVGGIYNNSGYKKVVYNDAINDAIYYVAYPPTRSNQDDTAALANLTTAQMNNTNRTQISGSAKVLLEDYGDYYVGDTIYGIQDRSIDFSAGVDNGPTVVHIVYKFQEQVIELTLDNHRVASLVRAKPLDPASNYNQHKLGVEHPSAQSGRGGHYLPETNSQGQNRSWEKYMENGGE